ncbi:FMN-binding protein [Nakamurella antarctica]|uniref:FMN-binding protein n=1 Tax=Nakamurella antarctica TaxID=1902245 RepID=A0A3G8ZW44_9ACTN|nr:FMN-binding protein [Nakamurella antarctica]AZI58236.1 FMN-binding protein [Nakamurella antarctica]
MRKITLAMFSTVSALVLLFSYKTSTVGGPLTLTSIGAARIVSAGAADESAASAKAVTAPSNAVTPVAPAALVVDGAAVRTEYGNVQVEATIADGKISSVKIIDYPNQQREDRQINSIAVPQLQSQALAAQSARVDGVSGATYTSEGFIQSLQSALDAAHFPTAS